MVFGISQNLVMEGNTIQCQIICLASREWAEYVFFHDNEAGIVTEWWCHTASSFWFLAQRDTITDEIVRTFRTDEFFQNRVDFEVFKSGNES